MSWSAKRSWHGIKDPGKRDAKLAVKYADLAMSHDPTAFLMKDAAAAGYARGGFFDKAVKLQQEVVDHLDQKYSGGKYKDYRARFHERLDLYKQGKPFPFD